MKPRRAAIRGAPAAAIAPGVATCFVLCRGVGALGGQDAGPAAHGMRRLPRRIEAPGGGASMPHVGPHSMRVVGGLGRAARADMPCRAVPRDRAARPRVRQGPFRSVPQNLFHYGIDHIVRGPELGCPHAFKDRENVALCKNRASRIAARNKARRPRHEARKVQKAIVRHPSSAGIVHYQDKRSAVKMHCERKRNRLVPALDNLPTPEQEVWHGSDIVVAIRLLWFHIAKFGPIRLFQIPLITVSVDSKRHGFAAAARMSGRRMSSSRHV